MEREEYCALRTPIFEFIYDVSVADKKPAANCKSHLNAEKTDSKMK